MYVVGKWAVADPEGIHEQGGLMELFVKEQMQVWIANNTEHEKIGSSGELQIDDSNWWFLLGDGIDVDNPLCLSPEEKSELSDRHKVIFAEVAFNLLRASRNVNDGINPLVEKTCPSTSKYIYATFPFWQMSDKRKIISAFVPHKCPKFLSNSLIVGDDTPDNQSLFGDKHDLYKEGAVVFELLHEKLTNFFH